MNEEDSLISNITLPGGRWVTDRDGEFWEFEHNGFVIEAEPFAERTNTGVVAGFEVALGHQEFGRLVNEILGDEPDAMVPLKTWTEQVELEDAATLKSSIAHVMNTIIDRMGRESLDPYLESFARSRPDSPSLAQANHLAALAWRAEFSVLDDYLSAFKSGKRLNFVPMITLDMIDRACDLAAMRMK